METEMLVICEKSTIWSFIFSVIPTLFKYTYLHGKDWKEVHLSASNRFLGGRM